MTEIGGYCTNCGASWSAGQSYCGRCGAALGTAASAGSQGAFGSSVTDVNDDGVRSPGGVAAGAAQTAYDAGSSSAGGPGNDGPYPPEAVIGAVLLTIFVPFISLIAALLLRAQEMRPARREQLKNWAITSGVWLATGWLIGIIVFTSAFSVIAPSGCRGGIDLAVPPSYESNDGKHWVGTFTCMNGGTITKPVPSSQVPGG
jgi:hypothetical protein